MAQSHITLRLRKSDIAIDLATPTHLALMFLPLGDVEPRARLKFLGSV